MRVPDGAVDPFRLTTANVLSARMHGADVMTYQEVVGFIKEGDRICGVRLKNRKNGEESEVRGSVTVSACGIWGHHVAELAGIKVNMYPAKDHCLFSVIG